MELKQYWQIVRRRLWMVVVLTVLAGGISFFLSPQSKNLYSASIRMIVSIPAQQATSFFNYDNIYTWQSSEYLIDDLSEIIKSDAFAQDIKAELGESFDIASIKGTRATNKTHRLLTVKVTSPDAEQARQVAEATSSVISKKGKDYLAQLQFQNAVVRVLDEPIVERQDNQIRGYVDMAVRTLLGAIAGLALTFLLHYLDSALYDAKEVESSLRLPVLGEIPQER